jgi:hypothetical protein
MAWFTRYQLEPDGMSYLDIARAVSAGHVDAAVHAYWSPGYPLLVSAFFRAFSPNAYWEFPLVHLVNLLIFIGSLASFQLFWDEVLRWHCKYAVNRDAMLSKGVFWALGYAAFGISSLDVITVGIVTPDLLISVFCYLAAWSALRLRRAPSVGRSCMLGVVLALAYYVKAPFFPMAVIFIVCACLWRPASPRMVLLAACAIATFLLVSAPFITALSIAKGRLTFGDSARLNQAFYINGVQYFRHWQGGPPGSGMPVHSTRKLNDFPETYEFATKNMGTYPPWFDPTYWYEGVTPHFDAKRQVAVFTRNLAVEFQIIMESEAGLVCVLIILGLLSSYRGPWLKGLAQLWFVWIPGAFALTMFALVHVEPRFLGGWLVMLFAGGVSACTLPAGRGTRRAVWGIGMGALVMAGALLVLQTSRDAVGIDHAEGRSSDDASIAVGLLNSGLHPGDQVAIIGDGTDAYWAHLARLHIIAEIPAGTRAGLPALDFWESGPELQQRALRIIEQTGAVAVVAGESRSVLDSVPSVVPAPWKKIDGTNTYIYFFHASP